MAEVKPGTKACDRCGVFKGVTQMIGHQADTGDADFIAVERRDLCSKCLKIVDNAIKRAVKPKT